MHTSNNYPQSRSRGGATKVIIDMIRAEVFLIKLKSILKPKGNENKEVLYKICYF